MIDLRSDTVTRPTEPMRKAMAAAEVGDDVFRGDPTVLELEATVAALLGKEDAVYVPTGTMSNQIALRTHTQPGDIVLAGTDAHIDSHEIGAANALAGITIHQLAGEHGTFEAHQVTAAIPNPPESMPPHLFQPVTLVACENTHMGAGGIVWPLDCLNGVAAAAHAAGAATHMDGARLWNATAASGVTEAEFAAGFDTVSVCFSKGLGAPVGSALVGSAELIGHARRFKQMYGGGFRQAGVIAAAALYALANNRERLAEDHTNAARLAAGLAEMPGIDLEADLVATNIVYFDVAPLKAADFCTALRDAGVAMLPLGTNRVRAVTHLEISSGDIDQALVAVSKVLESTP
jgi:threonine aldolase